MCHKLRGAQVCARPQLGATPPSSLRVGAETLGLVLVYEFVFYF
eukprot:SAG11_NODE_17958_length_504_cov_1.022222_1_plen_43_part_01